MSEDFLPKMADHIEMRSVEELIPYSKNARTHSENQVAQIANSIIEFGFTNPVLIDGAKGIIAGHGRLMAAKKLNLPQVPVVILDHLSEAQKRAYIIADNKLAENAGWDEEILANELHDLKEENFDLDLIGFEDQELEKLFANLYEDGEQKEEENIPDTEENPISKSGDIWILGDHKLICGDSTKLETYKTLLENELADMTFTDPPYNVDYGNTMKDNLIGKKNSKTGKEYKNSSGQRTILNDNLGNDFPKFLFDC